MSFGESTAAAGEDPRYWVNLFTAETWEVSQEGSSETAAWYAERNRKLRAELSPGDLIICYVARIGFTAVLRARGEPERVSNGPYGDAFPVKVPAEHVLGLDLETAMPVQEVRDRIDEKFNFWLIQSSGIEWPADIGRATVEALRRWAEDPERRALSRRQLKYKPRAGVASSLGDVTIPDDGDDKGPPQIEEPEGESAPTITAGITDHVRVQATLLRIGRLLGKTPWVTPDDKSRTDETGTPLDELPGVTTDLPRQFDEATNRTIRHIDAMWLYRNRVDAAFEVEATTSIYSGLLRMADLLALQPNINIPLFLVVPDDRLDRALRELGRPVFRAMVKPLPDACRVITFSRLAELEELVQRAGGHLATGVLEEFSESVEEATDEL